MGVIIFNNIPSTEPGFEVEIPPDYEVAERNYDIVQVPGRNGDVVIDLDSYKNVDRKYQISIGEEGGDFSVLASKIVQWMYSGHGYLRLEDTYEPEYFKLATIVNSDNILNILQQAGRTTLTFNRKPQRFLKIGEYPILISKETNINNPTNYKSTPLITIKCNGSGVVDIGGYSIKITDLTSGSITVDCETEESFNENLNLNNKVTIVNNRYPKLLPGDNLIRFSGGVSSVTIVPRWWII